MGTHSLARKLTPFEQWAAIKRTYAGAKGSFNKNSFSCRIPVQPTPLSEEYVLKVVFEKKRIESFSVFVAEPKPLKLADGAKELPHVYNNETQKLCLYRPVKNEWNSSMFLAKTVIHWAIEWLYFYEVWLCTGKWLGGGEHPPKKLNIK